MSLRLDWATYEAAKYACENWHYSKTMPCSKIVKIGVWENDKFIGVVLFSSGASPDLFKTYKLTQQECCELTRIALKKHIAPVSKIMSIALKMLRKSNPGLKLVVSFADTKEGHHGGIYQATNWIYVGTTTPRLNSILNGKHIHERTVSAMVKRGKIKRSDFEWIPAKPKYKYLMPLDNDMLSKIIHLKRPYPKRAGSKDNVAPGFQSGEGGVIPTSALQK